MTVSGLEKWGDSLIEEKLNNGNTIYYVEKNGMYFKVGIFLGRENKLEVYNNVNDLLMTILLNSCAYDFRIRIWYGDPETGRSWNEEYNTMGRIGRTTGNIKIPILVNNSRSWGGGAVLMGSIIRIDDIEDKRTLWKVPNFHVEDMKVYEIFGNENYKYQVAKLSEDSGKWEVQASFKTEKQAYNWVAFMRGERYRK